MVLAAAEKDRLENRQRTFRRYYEANSIKKQPTYFHKKYNNSDGKEYWTYNNKYFEQDRVN